MSKSLACTQLQAQVCAHRSRLTSNP
uniref:Uncharacterized protein n=1 Tax=Rhizophora mucronata TaxID=61149 RepID=A0A2P2R3T7_RHIMU